MSRRHCQVVLAAALLATVLLALTGPTPAEAARDLRLAPSAVEPTAPLVAALSLIAWALAGWLTLTVALTLLARAPGRAGGAATALTRRIAPPALHRLVGAALGATAVAGTLLVSPATAAPAPAPAPASALREPPAGPVVFDLDWPVVVAAAGPAPGRGAPADAPVAADVPDPVAPDPVAPAQVAPDQVAPDQVAPGPVAVGRVVVRPGDTLWGLAERALAQQAATSAAPAAVPSTARIACAWPSWWSVNREVVGDDPDLLLPGTVLRPPPAAALP
jgi:nucleoid-associated protein YgaU